MFLNSSLTSSNGAFDSLLDGRQTDGSFVVIVKLILSVWLQVGGAQPPAVRPLTYAALRTLSAYLGA